MEALKWIMSLLWPPTHEDPKLNRWQRHMAGSMMVVTVALAGLALTATGNFEKYGVGGFASSQDVQQVKQATYNIQAMLLERDIYDARREQCKAMLQNDTASKPTTLRRLEQLRADYQRITNREYRLPGCDEI